MVTFWKNINRGAIVVLAVSACSCRKAERPGDESAAAAAAALLRTAAFKAYSLKFSLKLLAAEQFLHVCRFTTERKE